MQILNQPEIASGSGLMFQVNILEIQREDSDLQRHLFCEILIPQNQTKIRIVSLKNDGLSSDNIKHPEDAVEGIKTNGRKFLSTSPASMCLLIQCEILCT